MEPGDEIDGRYRISSLIGTGGMGVVYRAHQLSVGRDVALKLIHADGNQEAIARFEQEARLIAGLRHANILHLYDFGRTQDGRLYLVTELLQGEPLDKLLLRGPLSERETLELVRQIASALSDAHAAGIVHRDLKPANVFIEKSGERLTVKVLDFGIAKSSEQHFQTSTSIVVGTPSYMSPEQARGERPDPRSDLYSLGVLAFECLSGRLPFAADSSVGVLVKHVCEPPPALSTLSPKPVVSEAVERLVARLLSKTAAARPASAEALVATISGLLEVSGSQRVSSTRALAPVPEALREPSQTQTPFDGSTSPGPRPARAPLRWGRLIGVLAIGLGVGLYTAAGLEKEPASTLPSVAPLYRLTRLPSDHRFISDPTISPDGKLIVFAAPNGSQNELFLQRIDGSRSIRLTNTDKRSEGEPAFSPDGSRIAFIGVDEQNMGALYVMGTTGEDERRLTGNAYRPAWSPDGKTIYYSTQTFADPHARSGTGDLGAIDLSSLQPRTILKGDAIEPSASPSGARVAYWVNDKRAQRDLWTVDAAGQHPVALTDDPAVDYSPVWDPSGQWLYFLSERAGTMALWRMGVDESSGAARSAPQPVLLGPAKMAGLRMAKSGVIVFVVVEHRATLHRFDFDPIGMKLSNDRSLLTRAELMGNFDASADGEELLYWLDAPSDDIVIVRADGNAQHVLSSASTVRNRAPKFSPDGSQIVFYSTRSGSWEAWTVGKAGDNLRRLTESDKPTIFPVWSPDARSMLSCDLDAGLYRFSIPNVGQLAKPEMILPATPGQAAFCPFQWYGDRVAGILLSATGGGRVGLLDMSTLKMTAYGQGDAPQLLPDGRHMLHSFDRYLVSVDLVTGTSQRIYEHSAPISGFALSRDGKTVYLAGLEMQQDLWTGTPMP